MGLSPVGTDAETIVTSPFRGVTRYERTETVPRLVVMNILEIDMTDPGVNFLSTPGNGAAPGEFTAQTTSGFVTANNLQIGINADFYAAAGSGPNGEIYRDVTNLAASNGSLISPWPANPGTARGALNISSTKVPQIVRPASGSGGTYNSTPTITPYNTVGGSNRMIENGNIIVGTTSFEVALHPRTVVGYKGSTLYLFTVDGRQDGWSLGMNLLEIATVLKNDYGVTDALNLDGGGSTTMVFADSQARVINRPSDGAERYNGNNLGVFATLWPQWGVNANGDWSVGSNWTTGVPNAVGAVAKFAANTTATRNITANIPATVGTITFESPHTYNIIGSQTLTMDVVAGTSSINVTQPGVHTMTCVIKLNDSMDVNVVSGASLSLGTAVSNLTGKSITKLGAGTLTISGAQSHSAGTALNMNAGVLGLNNNLGSMATGNVTVNLNAGTTDVRTPQHLASLNVATGAVAAVMTNGTNTLKTRTLTIASGGSLNLNDNDLVLNYTGASQLGSWNGSAYTGVTGLLASGRNDGAWNGTGINSARVAVNPDLYALAIGEASQVLGLSGTQTASWSGQVVDATSVLVTYTYAGDLNLDGRIDVDDYGRIDFATNLSGATGFFNGDMNLDGSINADDYGIIDFAFPIQGASMGLGASAMTVISVPEPACATLLAGAASLLLRRRRRAIAVNAKALRAGSYGSIRRFSV